MLQTFSSDKVAFRMDFRLDFKCRSNRRCCKCGVWVHCRSMELAAVGWCTRKRLRLHQTVRNLTSGDIWKQHVLFSLNTKGTLTRFPNESCKHSGSSIPFLRKSTHAITSISIKISNWMASLPTETPGTRPLLIFLLFQEPFKIT